MHHYHILRNYIKENALPNSRTKGRRLFEAGKCTERDVDLENFCATYIVQGEDDFQKHIVRIFGFNDEGVETRCNCPYTWKGICKHGVASLFALEDSLAKGGYKFNGHRQQFDQKDTQLVMDYIDDNILSLNSSPEEYARAASIVRSKVFTVSTDFEQRATGQIKIEDEHYEVVIQKKEDGTFHTSCGCDEQNYKLCIHKLMLFMQLSQKNGAYAFNLMRDLRAQKNNLLKEFGFSLEDEIKDKFGFRYDEKGSLKLMRKDRSILKLSQYEDYKQVSEKIMTGGGSDTQTAKYVDLKSKGQYGLGYGIVFGDPELIPNITIVPIVGKLDEAGRKFVSHVSPFLNNPNVRYLPRILEQDTEIMSAAQDLSFDALKAFVRRNCKDTPSFAWQYNNYFEISQFTGQDAYLLKRYCYGILKKIFLLLEEKRTFLLKAEHQVSINKINPISINNKQLQLQFRIWEEGVLLNLSAYLLVENEEIPLTEASFKNRTIEHDGQLYLIDNEELSEAVSYFSQRPVVKINKMDRLNFLRDFVFPLQKKFSLDFDFDLKTETKKTQPKGQIYLKEWDDFLVLHLIVDYDNVTVELDNRDEIYTEADGVIYKIFRDKSFEANFMEMVRALHPDFEQQDNSNQFYLSFKQVVNDFWFLDLFDKLKELEIEVFGFKNLSKLKYNTNRPSIRTQVSSGIDWFDVQVKVDFGGQEVNLKEVKKAILRNENFVKLGDGSIGILPVDWVKQYATLFKLSTVDEDSLKVSKIHFSLVDDLYDQIEDIEVRSELDFNRTRLRNFKGVREIPVPEGILADLRDYQQDGLNWLTALHNLGWGGCLADDMGLGKTLQILTFIQHLKNTGEEHRSHLVVSPTTLIFNWENEIKKFAPGLKVHRHHGPNRDRNEVAVFRSADVVLTSYGMVVSDVELFRKFLFEYIILDESQAIKNPYSKRYKAARLLNSKFRLVLTGTPVENNTFDLYAQLNFLNPGLLGSLEFFRSEFSNPIDRKNDEEKIDELRKIVSPFVLRRTKQKVAKELPEKTENILFCEMSQRQRRVYDAFKNEYRQKIVSRMAEVGLHKSGFIILEGLMKLRQICDSPALLNSDEDYGNDSIKLDVLMNHITERTNNHKILVFSQFLGMLDMVKKELEKAGIVYEYMAGSTPTKERQNKVERFQQDDSCRLFLISLKTGGVGINLTEADYVYLIDPWWNPAVEQQAIDRTHRIGQMKHIFAYRMICKNTIEEKIVKLQEKKRGLARDLISSEKGLLKNLTATEVEELFS